MRRNKANYSLRPEDVGTFKAKMLNWVQQFNIFVFLDNNSYPSAYAGYECLLAAGAHEIIEDKIPDNLLSLQRAHDAKKDWMFGHICYDYKNVLEPKLSSTHNAIHGHPLFRFFIPYTVCYFNLTQDILTIETFGEPELIYSVIANSPDSANAKSIPNLSFTNVVSKEQYIDTVNKLREHIASGDCYEINYCCSAYSENAHIEPLAVFNALNKLSPAPFAAYYRSEDKYLMCASPERYLRKEGSTILSQPIKGTARRDADIMNDTLIKDALRNDIKERAENVMIVDLVRNDLARCCDIGTVQVDELFGIYTFPQVHQMISTISGTLPAEAPFTDAIRTTFPMGSMTGAPKYKVMQLIDQYEHTKRELFSGTIGYITPGGDFDFNVIIRSLFYNESAHYLSYQTGGAITYDSDAGREWDEMRLKAWALERIFKGDAE